MVTGRVYPVNNPPAPPVDADHQQRLADGCACGAAALGYLRIGLSVLPLCPPDHCSVGKAHLRSCDSPGKVPLIRWAEFMTRRPTEAEVVAWWRRYPLSNIGVALGPISNLVRLD